MSLKQKIAAWVGKSLGWQDAWADLGSGGGSPRGELTRPYARSAWVHSAIGHVASPIALRPLVVTADRRGGDVVVDDAALTAFWERPGRNGGGAMNRADFLEATVGWLKLRGQCFWIMDDSWDTPRGAKSPLILARADEMHAIKDGRELIGWTWTSLSGQRAALIPEQVVHLKLWNPYDDILGLSDWEAAMIAAESDYAAGTFAKNLAQNNGDRGPYVIGKGGQYSDDQIKQVTAQLRAKREMGRRGDFRAAFLPADVEVHDPSVSSVDASYVAQRLENRKEVYIAFGVPPSFADPQASYSIGSASDRFRLIEDTCMPLGAKIEDAMEIVSRRLLVTKETIFVELDWDSHSTMQAVRAERFTTATQAVDRGMPWRAAGEYFRLKLPRFRGDDVGRVPFNLVEIQDGETRDARGEGEENVELDPLDELKMLFAAPVHGGCKAHAKAGGAEVGPALSAESQERWERVHRPRELWEKKFAAKVSRYLMDARGETLRNLTKHAEGKAAVSQKGLLEALEIIFDLANFLEKWTKGLKEISRNAMAAAGDEVWKDELHRDDPLTMPAKEVLDALQTRENRLKNAGEQVWRAVVDDLDKGIKEGETTDELAERIRKSFSGIDKTRAMAIAKTETTVAYETARSIAFRAAGVQYKQWLTSGLGNSRLSHFTANEQIVAIDEPFQVGGYAMLFPGDPEAPAAEVINCNCVSIAVSGPDGDIEGNSDETDIPY